MKIFSNTKMAHTATLRHLLFISMLFAHFVGNTQNTAGIRFVESDFNTWEEVKQVARQNNKYIFIDAYTTWCAPCKYMSQNIFPQKEVGDFFNKNFISIALQMDKTKKDGEQIKRWYKDAKMILEKYQIGVYPTYLFFDKDGDLIHTITGASNTKEDFLAKAKEAISPATQYSKLREDFKNGRSDSAFLLQLIHAARNAGDDSLLHIGINTYLATQDNLLTKQNILLITDGTANSNDKGFNVLLTHPKEVDDVVGSGTSSWLLGRIAFDEEIFPVIMPKGKITKHPGGMIIYGGGETNKHVNWDSLQTALKSRYGILSKEILLNGKLKYYQWLEDWKGFNTILQNYKLTESNLDTILIKSMAIKLLENAKGKETFKDALQWSSILASVQNHPEYLKVYSQVLYRAGKKRLALQYMNEYLRKTNKPDISKKAKLKMVKGESD